TAATAPPPSRMTWMSRPQTTAKIRRAMTTGPASTRLASAKLEIGAGDGRSSAKDISSALMMIGSPLIRHPATPALEQRPTADERRVNRVGDNEARELGLSAFG